MERNYLVLAALAVVLLLGVLLLNRPGGGPAAATTSTLRVVRSVADCGDLECVRGFAIREGFDPGGCAGVSEGLRSSCYYLYEAENKQVNGSDLSGYCLSIVDYDLKAECMYRCCGMITHSPASSIAMYEAMYAVNASLCDKVRFQELREECVRGVALMRAALDAGSALSCLNYSVGVQPDTMEICKRAYIERDPRSVISRGGQ